jgi:hypothetical protein
MRYYAICTLAVVAAMGAAAGGGGHADHPARGAKSGLAEKLAGARIATDKYATSLEAARADGYIPITPNMPNMGFHFMNPDVTGFDVRKPQILVYVKRGASTQLAALEWVFPKRPAKKPLPGARYGTFAAACHYADGTFVPAGAQEDCPATSPESGAEFGFWHPKLVTLHVWLWYHNPRGLYNPTNPLVAPFT